MSVILHRVGYLKEGRPAQGYKLKEISSLSPQ